MLILTSRSFSGRVGYDPIDIAPDVVIITHDHLDHGHTETIPGEFEASVLRKPAAPVRSVQVYHDIRALDLVE